jgi:hypothetical protein
MSKRNKIIYWIATLWLSLGMTTSGVFQLLKMEEEIEFILALGYPAYFLTLLGVWKLLGVVAILIPKYPLLKEWAYAGFFFAMTGAIYSHIVAGDKPIDMFGGILLLTLTILSWYFRPADRKIVSINK